MLVVGKDGFVDWVWSSENLRKSGVYLQPKKEPIELPAQSIAAQSDFEGDSIEGVNHKAGIWPFEEDVREMTDIVSEHSGLVKPMKDRFQQAK